MATLDIVDLAWWNPQSHLCQLPDPKRGWRSLLHAMRTRTHTSTASEDTLPQLWSRDKSKRYLLHKMWNIPNTERRTQPELIKHGSTSTCETRNKHTGRNAGFQHDNRNIVGADLSRPPPIYRPPVTVHDILLILLIRIIALLGELFFLQVNRNSF